MSQTKHEIRIEAIYKDLMSQNLIKSKQTVEAFEKSGTKAGKEVSSGFGSITKHAKKMVAPIAAAAAAFVSFRAATAGLKQGVNLFMEAEKALTEVASISGDVAKQTGLVSKEVRQLGLRFGIAEAQVSKGLYQTISSGITETSDALETLDVALGLSIAGIADSTATTDLLVSSLNAFGDAAGSAENVADVMFTTVRQGKTTISELAAAMPQVTSQAAALGVSMEETTAAVAAITLTGAPTAQAVTQVAAAMRGLLNKAEDVNEALGGTDGTGPGFNLARLRAEGLLPVLRDLRNAFDGNEEGLQQLLGRAEAMNAVFNLTGDNLTRFQGVLDGNRNAAGAYADALDTMANTTAQRWASIDEGFRQGLSLLGEDFVEGLTGKDGIAGGLDASAEAGERLRDTLEQLGDLAKTVGEGIKDIVDAATFFQRGKAASNLDEILNVIEMRQRLLDTGTTGNPYADRNLAGKSEVELMQEIVELYDDYIAKLEKASGAKLIPGNEFEVARDKAKAFVDEMTRLDDLLAGRNADKAGQAVGLLADGTYGPIDAVKDSAEQARASVEDLYNQTMLLLNIGNVGLGLSAGLGLPQYQESGGSGIPLSMVSPGLPAAPYSVNLPASSEAQGPQPDAGFVPWGQPGLTVEGGGGGSMTKGPTGAAKAWADLHKQVQMTDKKAEEFTSRMISDLGHDATNAIMDFATGAASAEEAFSAFASSFLSGMAEMIVQQLVFNAISGLGGLGGFANGGVAEGGMTTFADGGIAEGGLIGYANGGPIVTKPHLAMVGEGHYDEAVVPLTGGREIPVQLNGGGGGGATVNFNITAMDGADVERVVAKNPGTFRAVIEEAMLTNQSFRSTMRSVR